MSAKQISRFVAFGRKIVGIGRNYREHAAELKHPLPEEPIVFLKPTSSYVTEGQNIQLPVDTTEIHHEVELGVVIGRGGKNIPQNGVEHHIGGYVLALDMTNRALQSRLISSKLPWALAKGFDTACAVSELLPVGCFDPKSVDLWLSVNGKMRQQGNTRDMIFSVDDLVSFVSRLMTLEPGDLILTGTPSGVGAVVAGDVIECGLSDVSMRFRIAKHTSTYRCI